MLVLVVTFGVPHYYDLHIDYLVGHIDRHDYFGDGGGGHPSFSPVSMLAQPQSPTVDSQ